MRRLVATVVVLSWSVLFCLCSVGGAQDAHLSMARLRARVEAEVEEFTREAPVDPRLQERFGTLGARALHLSARVGAGAAAQALPVDWLVHSEIVWPLTDAGLVPSYMTGIEPAASSSDCVVVVLRYSADDNPKNELSCEQDDLRDNLDAMKLSGPIFGRNGFLVAGVDPGVLFVRDFSSQSKDTTATVTIRCRVREQKTGRFLELVASEEWQFQPTDNRQQRCWKRVDAQHDFCPGDEQPEPPISGTTCE